MAKSSRQIDGDPDLDRLERAAAKLRPIELQVLLLSACDGLRTDEIATRLEISAAAAEQHLADALDRLTLYLDRQARPWWKLW